MNRLEILYSIMIGFCILAILILVWIAFNLEGYIQIANLINKENLTSICSQCEILTKNGILTSPLTNPVKIT
jgi:hypothetical protein